MERLDQKIQCGTCRQESHAGPASNAESIFICSLEAREVPLPP